MFFLKFIQKLIIISAFFIIYPQYLLAKDDITSYKKIHFSFNGVLGKIDKPSARRGLQVYSEICAGCHSLKHVAYRNLVDLGFSNDQVKEFSSQYEVLGEPDSQGEVRMRKALPSDKFVDPYDNINQAKAMNRGALPPDLSLILKARADGANYFYYLLNGYTDPPDNFELVDGYYNKVFPGHVIVMPQPLYGDDVAYIDGTEATLEQEIQDLIMFLTWTGQPELDVRKQMGFKTILFLIFMTIMLFLSYKKIWKRVKSGIV